MTDEHLMSVFLFLPCFFLASGILGKSDRERATLWVVGACVWSNFVRAPLCGVPRVDSGPPSPPASSPPRPTVPRALRPTLRPSHAPARAAPTCRFDKNDILRIVRALAIVRPSFIALQMPMSEEDEVFVEKCFQRSLIELDKLVSFSGTPTVAWRRTGEICLVGPEFCMLTGWEREELVGRRKYIYEVSRRFLTCGRVWLRI